MSAPPQPHASSDPTAPTTCLTRASLRAAGLSAELTRGLQLRRVTHGVHRWTAESPTPWSALGYPAPPAPFPPEETAAIVEAAGGVASHLTALLLHRVPLPPSLTEDGRVHVSRPHERGSSVRVEVTSHARTVPAADATEIHGIRVTGIERTWADLAALLTPWMVDPLVAAGDAVVNPPWHPEGRSAPRTTTAQLRSALDRAGRFKGVRTARRALDLVRVGADSPQETALRLALLHAGLPEPALQLRLHPGRAWSPDADLGYPAWRIVLHYDGDHHLDPEQRTRDRHRDEGWARAGWAQTWATVDDAQDDFRRVVTEVKAHRDRLRGREYAIA